MKISHILKNIRALGHESHEKNRLDTEQHVQATVRLEHLVDTYGKTIQKLESHVARLQQGTGDYAETIQNLTGSSLELNSFYVDRVPTLAHEFDDWDKSNLSKLHECIKDREWHHFYDMAMALIACTSDGDYYEFGCCGAGSMRMALSKAKKWHLDDMNYYAFDSFKGMPADGTLAMNEGDFLFSVQSQGINVDKVTTIPGFYGDSLTVELQKDFIKKPRRPILISVDCDLHESAAPVFNFIAPLLKPGTILYLDDFWETFNRGRDFGTALAFNDFCDKGTNLEFYPFMRVGYWGMSFIAYDPEVFTAPTV
jgi:hypothetical protein